VFVGRLPREQPNQRYNGSFAGGRPGIRLAALGRHGRRTGRRPTATVQLCDGELGIW
jgi:hypothetical protein